LTTFISHGWRALAAALLLAGLAQPLAAAETVPLPRPRPPDLGAKPDSAAIPLPPLRSSIPPAVAPTPDTPTPPSACQLRLPEIAAFTALPPIIAANGCGIEDPVKIAAVLASDGRRIAINPPATLRCTTAEAVAYWVRDDIAPIAAGALGSPLAAVANFDSYECRGRNRVAGAIISEHGKGNAIDIRALMLANGKHYELTDAQVDRGARERLKASACARFTTVLGPESDGYHENHVHVDLAERHGGYRICHWAVHDAFALVPLPRERPPEAPPREE
jgi:hypothetical protein